MVTEGFAPTIPEDLPLEEGEVLLVDVRIKLLVLGFVDPVRFRRGQDHLVVRTHPLRDLGKVVELRLVAVRVQLDIGANEPPSVRRSLSGGAAVRSGMGQPPARK